MSRVVSLGFCVHSGFAEDLGFRATPPILGNPRICRGALVLSPNQASLDVLTAVGALWTALPLNVDLEGPVETV